MENEITVVAPIAIDDETKDSLTAILEKKLGSTIKIQFKVEPDILGGIVVYIGSRVIDISFEGMLKQINNEIKYD